MSQKIKAKEFRIELEPVEELPQVIKKGRRIEEYDKTISEFLNSKYQQVRVKIFGKDMKTVYTALSKRIRDQKAPIKLAMRGNDLYLVKLGELEFVEEVRKKLKKAIPENV